MLASWPIFTQFFVREVKSRYLGSVSGLLWVLLHPVLLMLLYAGLIGQVLKARIPGVEAEQWLPFVALGLWPWMCFAEGLQRGTQAILEHAGLIAKVAIPSAILVTANVAATFCLHTVGMAAALLVMKLLGYPILLSKFPFLLFLLANLFVLTLGLAWITAAVQVYLRDLGQLLGQILSFWFFLTPIVYSAAMLPEAVRAYLFLNPISYFCQSARAWMLFGDAVPAIEIIRSLTIALLLFGIGRWVFKRLARHFEDFL